MKFFFLTTILALSGIASAQTSYVAPTKILGKKGYQLGGSADYWSTSKRVDKDGKNVSFESGESFSRIQGSVFGSYGLTENLQVSGGARFRQNQSKSLNSTTAQIDNETSTGVESTWINLIYAFKPVNQWHYTLEGSFRYRPFTNEETVGTNKGSLILGDDGNEYSAGLGLTYASRTNNFLTVRGGYRNPGSDLSSEIYWQAEGALQWTYVALIAGADGVISNNNDPYNDDPQNRPVLTTGSTALYNGINRQFVAPYLGMNFALGQAWRIELRGSQVVSARSYDLGSGFGVSLIRRVDTKNGIKPDKVFKDYDIEATVSKISPQKGYVVIDKGLSSDVQKGMKIDFYEFDYVGGNILLASGVVIQTKSDTSIVKVTHLYNTKKELKEGIIARGAFR